MKPRNPKLTRVLAAVIGATSEAAAQNAVYALNLDPVLAIAEARRQGLLTAQGFGLTARGRAWASAEVAALAPLAAALEPGAARRARLIDLSYQTEIRAQAVAADRRLARLGVTFAPHEAADLEAAA